jgi:hypothetical protein
MVVLAICVYQNNFHKVIKLTWMIILHRGGLHLRNIGVRITRVVLVYIYDMSCRIGIYI